MTPLYIVACNKLMHKRNFMIFDTNKLHKGPNGMLPINGNTLGGATCILACMSHTGSEFSEKVVRTTLTNTTVSW